MEVRSSFSAHIHYQICFLIRVFCGFTLDLIAVSISFDPYNFGEELDPCFTVIFVVVGSDFFLPFVDILSI